MSAEVRARVEKLLTRHLRGFRRLARFEPYLRGAAFGVADIAGYISLPLVAMATQKIYGRDFLLEAGIDWQPYKEIIEARPAARRVMDDRKMYVESTRTA